MEITLQNVRKELINEVEGILRTKGCYDTEEMSYEIPVYHDTKSLTIFRDETAIMIKSVLVPQGSLIHGGELVRKVHVETFDDMYDIDELYADDIQDIIDFINAMTDDDFYKARQEYENIQNGEYEQDCDD